MTESLDRLDSSLAQARHWVSIGRPEKALEALAVAGPAAADEPAVFHLQALAHLQREDLRAAGASATKGLALDPQSPALLEILGIVQWKQDDRPAAERFFLAGLSQAPDDPHLLARYGLLVGEAGQLDKARRLADRAAAVAPQDALVGKVRSLIAYMAGDDKAAKEIGAGALAGAPEDAGLHALMGSYLLQGGDFERATKHHLTTASINPEHEDARALGRQAKLIRHPLMRPLWLAEKFGPGKIWIAFLVLVFGLRGAGLEEAAGITGLVYLAFVMYSWVVPPILRRRLKVRS